ncbi:GNAT family N-acetyltransferase [Senegalia massiliensis]|uniref:GNAT family N-acetyltransferase n=1 Tax=Senegalia massiliensis TaxID=1720316 RepID=UPI001030FD74|nr:GNAT family N-acetyltransferase [Senegalia massiliensis]
MGLEFRSMDKKDILDVYEFFNDLKEEKAEVTFVDVNSKDEVKQMLEDKNNYLYICEDEGELIAVFRGIKGKGKENHSAFLTLAVRKKLRGKKIAQRLTEFGLKDMKNDGIKIVRAYVYNDNYASLNTLLKLRFSISGSVHMDHYDETKGHYVDDIIFHKIL